MQNLTQLRQQGAQLRQLVDHLDLRARMVRALERKALTAVDADHWEAIKAQHANLSLFFTTLNTISAGDPPSERTQ